MPEPVTVLAPSKINLTLAVLGKRADGFHEIESWVMQIGGLHDLVTLEYADELSLQVTGRTSGIPTDESNLVWRAAALLADAAGKPCHVHIELNKQIPPGAGLGGGSSDAAATLLGLRRMWIIDERDPIVVRVAETLGSDVPFFLQSRPAILRGRGERIVPLERTWQGWIGVVVPPITIPTAEVYKRWSAAQRPARDSPSWKNPDIDAATLSASVFNDLEPAAFSFEPRLADWANRISKLGPAARMTGSGSGFFTLFDNQREMETWCLKARHEFSDACVWGGRAPARASAN